MIFACHKGFALTHNEFYWGQISSYPNTSLPPEIQGSGNYFAITVHFFLGSYLGSSLISWNILLSKTCYSSAQKADKTFVPFMAKKLLLCRFLFSFPLIYNFSTALPCLTGSRDSDTAISLKQGSVHLQAPAWSFTARGFQKAAAAPSLF